jgi:hypothetical protein
MDTRWVRRTLAALGLAALTACGGGSSGGLARAPGTSTSTAPRTAAADAPTAPSAVSPSTVARTTTTKGTTTTAPGPVLIRYRVELHTTDDATSGFAAAVDAILTDRRGWQQAGFVFQRADDGPYTILLGEGPEVQQRCRPYDTYGKYSCQLGPLVAITADRWRSATPEWTGDLATYREMVVDHEVGHLLGLHHRYCPGAGQPAPVMNPQSTELHGCLPNPWPLPVEVARASRHDLPLAPGYEAGDPRDPP